MTKSFSLLSIFYFCPCECVMCVLSWKETVCCCYCCCCCCPPGWLSFLFFRSELNQSHGRRKRVAQKRKKGRSERASEQFFATLAKEKAMSILVENALISPSSSSSSSGGQQPNKEKKLWEKCNSLWQLSYNFILHLCHINNGSSGTQQQHQQQWKHTAEKKEKRQLTHVTPLFFIKIGEYKEICIRFVPLLRKLELPAAVTGFVSSR